MSTEPLIPITLPGGLFGLYILVTAIIGVVIIAKYWIDKRRASAVRMRFLDQYDLSRLRSNPKEWDSIYRVVDRKGTSLRVVPIWGHGKPITNGTEYEFDAANLTPVNRERFIAGD